MESVSSLIVSVPTPEQSGIEALAEVLRSKADEAHDLALDAATLSAQAHPSTRDLLALSCHAQTLSASLRQYATWVQDGTWQP